MAKKPSKKRSKSISVKTIDLKKLCKSKSPTALQNVLKKVCESEVAIIVHNAPFAVA